MLGSCRRETCRAALCMARTPLRAVSSAGRALRLHRRGRRFEPVTAHHLPSLAIEASRRPTDGDDWRVFRPINQLDGPYTPTSAAGELKVRGSASAKYGFIQKTIAAFVTWESKDSRGAGWGMASPVRALSNHYETLQVSQSATTEEIVQAFASHMRAARMRPDISVVRLAQLSVAYETLRDPAKRRTYDASIGLGREPAAAPPKISPFIGASVIDRSPNAPVQPRAPLAEQARSEPRVAVFIAASLREPSNRSEQTAATPVARAEAAPPSGRAIDPTSTPVDERLEIEEGRLSIGRTGATLTAGVIGVAILAFAAALPERNPNRLPVRGGEAEPGLTVPVPPATPNNDSLVASQPLATPTTSTASTSSRLQARPTRAAPQRKPRPTPWLAVNDKQPAAAISDKGEGQPLPTQAVAQQSSKASPAAETPAAAPDPAPVTVPAATLPLANATIARTIERIGYSCGRVVSATGIEGAAGVFNITCSSGDTYRAAPVRGRYHFRRMGSH